MSDTLTIIIVIASAAIGLLALIVSLVLFRWHSNDRKKREPDFTIAEQDKYLWPLDKHLLIPVHANPNRAMVEIEDVVVNHSFDMSLDFSVHLTNLDMVQIDTISLGTGCESGCVIRFVCTNSYQVGNSSTSMCRLSLLDINGKQYQLGNIKIVAIKPKSVLEPTKKGEAS